MKAFDCCYANCHEPGTIHIGENGNPATHWICWIHLAKWNARRARFLREGGACEMQLLGEPLCDDCDDEGKPDICASA